MDEATYAAIPSTMTLREVRYCVTKPGRRTQVLIVVTTLLDAEDVHAARHRRAVWLSLEFGTGYSFDQAKLELGACALQVARNGPPRIVDDDPGLQPDSHHRRGCRGVARQAAKTNQLRRHVRIRAGVVVLLLDGLAGCGRVCRSAERCWNRSPAAKSPIAPAASSRANSNGAATATSSCKSLAENSAHASRNASNRHFIGYNADSAIRS